MACLPAPVAAHGTRARRRKRTAAGWRRASLGCWALWTALAPAAAPAAAVADVAAVRADEIARCLPGELVTWGDGRDRPAAGGAVRLAYRHAGAPPWFDEALVVGTLQRAALAWSACGVPAEVIADSGVGLNPTAEVQVRWDDAGTRGNFALANLANRSLSLSPAMFALLRQRNPRHPAVQTLQMTLSHEMGHFFGLMAHSRRCIDVMSYYDNGQGQTCATRDGGSPKAVVEYRALLPTACDIARCRAVNGQP